MQALPVILLSIIIFLFLVVNMAIRPARSARVTAYLMLLAVIGGSVIYGKAYMDVTGNLFLSLVRTPFSVVGMFLGKNDLQAVSSAPWLQNLFGLICFWSLHLVAFCSVASAAIITVGAEGLRGLRLFLALKGDLTIIYGINDNSISVGKECNAHGNKSVVFIDEDVSSSKIQNIINMGMAVVTSSVAVQSEIAEIRRLRVGARTKIEIYALHEDKNKNLFYAISLRDALEKLEIPPEKTSITLPGTEEILTSMLQVTEDKYGFGYVNVFEAPEIMATAMIRLCPPWNCMTFDSDCKAEQDFDCAVIGSGDCGQEALRHLIMNAQFVGSSFHAAMFSPKYNTEAGYLFTECRELLNRYSIDFFEYDGRSIEFYEYLTKRLGSLKYIAVCTGSDEMNSDVADHLMLFLKRMRAEHVCVLQCTKDGVRYQAQVASPIMSKKVYSYEMLSAAKKDKNAILINSVYDNSDRTDWEKWIACDTFSKMSSRASAEFIPATVRAAGSTLKEAASSDWTAGMSADKLNTLGEMEHLRWCAFYFANGYKAMSEEEFEKNAENYRESIREKRDVSPRIAKDSERRIHACLIPYDELDALSEREKSITGRNVNYRQADINNVLIIPKILAGHEDGE